MFGLILQVKELIEFNLSTPYDTQHSYSHSFGISGASTILQELEFDDDGTRMYVTEATGAAAQIISMFINYLHLLLYLRQNMLENIK